MPNGNQKRSSRENNGDGRKEQKMRSEMKNNGKFMIAALEVSSSEEDEVNLKRKRTTVKTKSIKDLVGNGSGVNRGSSGNGLALMPSDAVLPEKSKLKLLLESLKKRDGRNIFAEPVVLNEVKGYYEIIEEPMDFGTMTMKLENDQYKTLKEFEYDVTLVHENAMLFNASNTIYYRQARFISNLADKLFSLLKDDPENFEKAVRALKIRSSVRRDDPVNQSSNATNLNGSDEEAQYRFSEEDQRSAYKSLIKQNESVMPPHFRNAEPLLAIKNNMQNEDGCQGTWKQFINKTGPISESQKLISDSEGFNTYCAITPQQLQAKKYGVPNAPSWDAGLYGNQPKDALPCAASNRNLPTLMDLQNWHKALNLNVLLYNKVLCRTLLSLGFNGQGAIPWNGVHSNPNTFMPVPQLNGNVSSTPRNQDGIVFGSVKDDKSTPMQPISQDGFVFGSVQDDKTIQMVDLTKLCTPKQSIGNSYQGLSGAENSYLNSEKLWPGSGSLGMNMNFQPIGNPNETLIQPPQSKGEAGSAFNELMPNAGYYTNLLLNGVDPSFLSDDATQKFIPAPLNQGPLSFQAQMNNLGPIPNPGFQTGPLGLRINENAPSPFQRPPPMAAMGPTLNQAQSPWLNLNLNLPSMEFQLDGAINGYGGQAPSLAPPFGWPSQPNFNIPMQESGVGDGFSAQAELLMQQQVLGSYGGAAEQGNAAPFAGNYP